MRAPRTDKSPEKSPILDRRLACLTTHRSISYSSSRRKRAFEILIPARARTHWIRRVLCTGEWSGSRRSTPPSPIFVLRPAEYAAYWRRAEQWPSAPRPTDHDVRLRSPIWSISWTACARSARGSLIPAARRWRSVVSPECGGRLSLSVGRGREVAGCRLDSPRPDDRYPTSTHQLRGLGSLRRADEPRPWQSKRETHPGD